MATSPQPADPPFSLEPVLGWRVWRLSRTDGVFTLVSMTRSDNWPPNEAMEAGCTRHGGAVTPIHGCACGLYAASSPENLARSGIFNRSVCVVGAIAMWGTVVEHARGARSRFAYPARLRLACGRCLAAGAGAVDPTTVVDAGGYLTAVCARHSLGARSQTWPADLVQSELLSTYGVDPMPIERIARSLRSRPRATAAGVVHNAPVMRIWLLLRIVFGAIIAMWVLSGVLLIGGAVMGGVFHLFDHGSAPPPVVASTSPVASVGVLSLPWDDFPDRGTPPPHHPAFPAFAILCGVGEGGSVSIVPCEHRPRDLLGFAERTAPKGAKHDCITKWDAYSRGNHYWICWSDLWGPLSVLPWASAPSPWSIPVGEGGAIHEHR